MKKNWLLATSAFSNSDLLEQCVKSWPKNKVSTLVFLDGKNNKKVFKNLLEDDIILNYVDNYISSESHKGASGSWNIILKFGFEQNNFDRIIIVGSDTEMKEGFFEKLENDLEEKNPDFSCCMGFNCFTINKKCMDTVGLLDENYFPAYYEDNDYDTRVRLAKDTILYDICGDESLLNHYGSATIRKDENFNKANGQTFPINQQYHIRKWGCTVQNPAAYTYNTPFNDLNLTIKDWTLEMNNYLLKKQIWEQFESRI